VVQIVWIGLRHAGSRCLDLNRKDNAKTRYAYDFHMSETIPWPADPALAQRN